MLLIFNARFYTCSFNDQRYLEGILYELRKKHAQQNRNTNIRNTENQQHSEHLINELKISRAREHFEFRPHRPHWQNFYGYGIKLGYVFLNVHRNFSLLGCYI